LVIAHIEKFLWPSNLPNSSGFVFLLRWENAEFLVFGEEKKEECRKRRNEKGNTKSASFSVQVRDDDPRSNQNI